MRPTQSPDADAEFAWSEVAEVVGLTPYRAERLGKMALRALRWPPGERPRRRCWCGRGLKNPWGSYCWPHGPGRTP